MSSGYFYIFYNPQLVLVGICNNHPRHHLAANKKRIRDLNVYCAFKMERSHLLTLARYVLKNTKNYNPQPEIYNCNMRLVDRSNIADLAEQFLSQNSISYTRLSAESLPNEQELDYFPDGMFDPVYFNSAEELEH